MIRLQSLFLFTVCSFVPIGCVFAPDGTNAERERLTDAGRAYEREDRALPELSESPTPDEFLARAALANGELEAAFHEWRAALARVDVEGAWPNTNVALDFEYMFSSGSASAFDRTTIGAGFDPMQNLDWPSETKRAAHVAFAEARAAGERFRAARFALARRVTELVADGALLEERVRAQRERVDLARVASDTSAARIESGGRQRALVDAQLDSVRQEVELVRLESELVAARTALNALVARDPSAPLRFALPPPEELPADDDLLAAGAAANPELAALALEVEGRTDALELARLRRLPDVSPFVAFTGSASQSIGAMLSLPLHRVKLNAEIEIARAELDRARALARQARADRGAELVARLFALRSTDTLAAYFDRSLTPAAAQLEQSAQDAYVAGSTDLPEWIESRTFALELRVARAELVAERSRIVAAIEELIGEDIQNVRLRAEANEANPAQISMTTTMEVKR